MKKLIFFLFFSITSFAQIHTISGKKIPFQKFNHRIEFLMDSLKVTGMSIAIIENGKLAFKKSYGYANLESKLHTKNNTFFEAASLSKPVFAYFVLKLKSEGIIDLDKPLFEYLPNTKIKDERYKRITARMVLCHSTGLPNWSETDITELQFDPGTGFSYSGEAYIYLSQVIAKLNNKSLEDLDEIFQLQVANPLHLNNFYFKINQKIQSNLAHGYQNAKPVYDDRDRNTFDSAGGLLSDITSYTNFLIYLLQTKPIEMFTPMTKLNENDPIVQYFNIDSWTMGMGIAKRNDSENFWHAGNNLGYTNAFMINPQQKYGYVFFTNEDQCNAMNKLIEQMLWK